MLASLLTASEDFLSPVHAMHSVQDLKACNLEGCANAFCRCWSFFSLFQPRRSALELLLQPNRLSALSLVQRVLSFRFPSCAKASLIFSCSASFSSLLLSSSRDPFHSASRRVMIFFSRIIELLSHLQLCVLCQDFVKLLLQLFELQGIMLLPQLKHPQWPFRAMASLGRSP